jgi:putative transcriptional regulator
MAKKNVAKEIVASMQWAARHSEGKAKGGRLTVIHVPDVRDIRSKLSLSQSQFAKRFGLNVRTIQDWEQGRKVPDQPARVLLRVIEKSPRTVAKVLTP